MHGTAVKKKNVRTIVCMKGCAEGATVRSPENSVHMVLLLQGTLHMVLLLQGTLHIRLYNIKNSSEVGSEGCVVCLQCLRHLVLVRYRGMI